MRKSRIIHQINFFLLSLHDPVKHIAKLKKTVSHPSRNAAQSLAETGRTHRQPAFIICFDVFV